MVLIEEILFLNRKTYLNLSYFPKDLLFNLMSLKLMVKNNFTITDKKQKKYLKFIISSKKLHISNYPKGYILNLDHTTLDNIIKLLINYYLKNHNYSYHIHFDLLDDENKEFELTLFFLKNEISNKSKRIINFNDILIDDDIIFDIGRFSLSFFVSLLNLLYFDNRLSITYQGKTFLFLKSKKNSYISQNSIFLNKNDIIKLVSFKIENYFNINKEKILNLNILNHKIMQKIIFFIT